LVDGVNGSVTGKRTACLRIGRPGRAAGHADLRPLFVDPGIDLIGRELTPGCYGVPAGTSDSRASGAAKLRTSALLVRCAGSVVLGDESTRSGLVPGGERRGTIIDRPLIALVNDDARFLGLVSALLDRRGFRTACYALHDQTYADLRLGRPDLLILSLSSSSERPFAAWHLLTLLRLDDDTAGIPAILCTPDTRLLADKATRLHTMGCDVLEEPFTQSNLLAKVQSTFTRVIQWDHEL
jgi:CheY-like chemotaxis protein